MSFFVTINHSQNLFIKLQIGTAGNQCVWVILKISRQSIRSTLGPMTSDVTATLGDIGNF
jgi:hypothetical protein